MRFEFVLEVVAQGVGQQVHQQNDDDEHKGRTVGNGYLFFHVSAAGGQHVQVIGQGHTLVEHALRQLGQEVGGAGEEDGGRFARHAPQRQNEARNDVGHGHGQNHAAYGLQLGGTQRQTAFAETVGNGFECLFRGADYQGEGQQAECERSGQNAVAKTEKVDEERHAEQSEHDGGNAGQVVGHHADKAYQAAAAGIFVHVDAAHDAQRKGKYCAACHQVKRAYDGRPDAAAFHAVSGWGGDEVPVEHAGSFNDDKRQDDDQDAYDNGAQQAEQAEGYALSQYFSGVVAGLKSFFAIHDGVEVYDD